MQITMRHLLPSKVQVISLKSPELLPFLSFINEYSMFLKRRSSHFVKRPYFGDEYSAMGTMDRVLELDKS